MYDKALQSATRMLASREHSVLELTRKLQQKDFPPEIVDRVVTGLLDGRLLSDARFAETYVRMRSARGYGPVRIRMELRERGVDDATIRQYLDTDEVDWYALAEEVRERKYGADAPSDYAQKAKQMRFLQYRGFANSHISVAVKGLDD
ncbi:MAG: regulatory protein RecX [Granulosicoccaceae bacterium]|jgi:regulatory protein